MDDKFREKITFNGILYSNMILAPYKIDIRYFLFSKFNNLNNLDKLTLERYFISLNVKELDISKKIEVFNKKEIYKTKYKENKLQYFDLKHSNNKPEYFLFSAFIIISIKSVFFRMWNIEIDRFVYQNSKLINSSKTKEYDFLDRKLIKDYFKIINKIPVLKKSLLRKMTFTWLFGILIIRNLYFNFSLKRKDLDEKYKILDIINT